MNFCKFEAFLQGVLRVHVVEAKHLMKKDIGMLGKGKSDPYAVITVGAQEFKTKVINNSVDPKWDYWCEVSAFEKIRMPPLRCQTTQF